MEHYRDHSTLAERPRLFLQELVSKVRAVLLLAANDCLCDLIRLLRVSETNGGCQH